MLPSLPSLARFRPRTPLHSNIRGLPVCLSAQHFHACAAALGSKNHGWYHRALAAVVEEPPPPFPAPPVGHARPRAYLDLRAGAPGEEAPSPPTRVVIELADDVVPLTVLNFINVRDTGGGVRVQARWLAVVVPFT